MFQISSAFVRLDKENRIYLTIVDETFHFYFKCLIFLDEADQVAEILQKLVRGSTDQMLMAYQIGFDLYESATQQFLNKIQDVLRVQAPIPIFLDRPQSTIKDEQGFSIFTEPDLKKRK